MIKIVTGFVPIPNHPRPIEEYAKLGEQLYEVDHPTSFVHQNVETCWLFKFLQWKPQLNGVCAQADNPKKNTFPYHIVQHQKTEWLSDVAYMDPVPDVFAWIDWGIFSVPGVTAAVIYEFLRRAAHERAIVIPGCWDKPASLADIPDLTPCWRFCGGLWVVPREYIMELDNAMKREAMEYITRTGIVSWEVNTLARVELKNPSLPIWHYKADHNETMFTNYPETHNAG